MNFKKMEINEGEVPQYYVENSHPAIVTPETFDMVQYELSQRKSNRGYKPATARSPARICGECGGAYSLKVWHSTSKYRRTIWQGFLDNMKRHDKLLTEFDEKLLACHSLIGDRPPRKRNAVTFKDGSEVTGKK